MIISWDSPLRKKSLSFVFGSEWEKEDFKFIEWYKTPLGWNFNLWRIAISYDDFGRVRSR